MKGAACRGCGAGVADGIVACRECVRLFRMDLTTIGRLWDALDDAVARRVVTGRGGGRGAGPRVPVDWKAVQVRDSVGYVAGWCEPGESVEAACARLGRDPQATYTFAGHAEVAARKLLALLDRPEAPQVVGVCKCGRQVSATRWEQSTRCECGRAVDLVVMRDKSAQAARGHYVPIAVVVDAAFGVFRVRVTDAQVRRWVAADRVRVLPWARPVHVHVGDVVDAARAAGMKTRKRKVAE